MNRTRVFLSYAREDAAAARRLRTDLQSAGFSVWFDEDALLPGQDWQRELHEAISATDYFLPLLSSSSVQKRGVVQKEIRRALDILETIPERAIFIVPARLEPCEPSYHRLRELHWVDLFEGWDNGVAKLVRTLGLPKTRPPQQEWLQPPEAPEVFSSETISLTRLVFESLELLQAAANSRNVVFHIVNHAPAAQLDVKVELLRLALVNLLLNAMTFGVASADGKIDVTVRTSRQGECLEVAVENVGSPVHPDEMQHLFSPGYRGRDGLRKATKGSGYGLYLVKRAAIELRGDALVTSTPIRSTAHEGESFIPHYFVATLRIAS